MPNFEESDILLESIFGSSTYLYAKKWKYSFLFSGESRLNSWYKDYTCVLYGEKNHDNIINIPLFIPVPEMGDKFSRLLDKYPVTPYLDSRDSFVRWAHFIHNKYNVLLGKPEIPLPLALEIYRNEYKPKPVYLGEIVKMRKHYLIMAIILILIGLIIIYYNQ